jgi:hypothetical protein
VDFFSHYPLEMRKNQNYYTAVTLALLPPALAYAAPKGMDYQGLPA